MSLGRSRPQINGPSSSFTPRAVTIKQSCARQPERRGWRFLPVWIASIRIGLTCFRRGGMLLFPPTKSPISGDARSQLCVTPHSGIAFSNTRDQGVLCPNIAELQVRGLFRAESVVVWAGPCWLGRLRPAVQRCNCNASVGKKGVNKHDTSIAG